MSEDFRKLFFFPKMFSQSEQHDIFCHCSAFSGAKNIFCIPTFVDIFEYIGHNDSILRHVPFYGLWNKFLIFFPKIKHFSSFTQIFYSNKASGFPPFISFEK